MSEAADLRVRPWQWLFGAIAPLVLIAISLVFMKGGIVRIAPVALWMLALFGPVLLALSQRRWPEGCDRALNGALGFCFLAALAVFVLPLAFVYRQMFETAAITFDIGGFFWALIFAAIATAIMAPVLVCALAYWRQWSRRRPSWRTGPSYALVAGALALPAIMIAGEVGDRRYLQTQLEALETPDAPVVVATLDRLAFYPLMLFGHQGRVCAAIYGDVWDSMVSVEAIEEDLLHRFGDDASRVSEAARRALHTRAPAERCAHHLSTV